MSFQKQAYELIRSELPQLKNVKAAVEMKAYMKDISPYLGVKTPARRALGRTIFNQLPDPTSNSLGKTVQQLWDEPYREFQYMACDLITYFIDFTDKQFLSKYVEYLITHKSWWDSVDSLGTAAVSPLTSTYNLKPLMNKWNKSENIWLIRAAIQHQRGRGSETDVELLLKFCSDHALDKEFFVAKAIGWALRDLARFDRKSVNAFLKKHPELSAVAIREARKHE